METDQIPGTLPPTITRPRPHVAAVMAQSLTECAPGGRTANAWRWVLTGHGLSPVSDAPASDSPPSAASITAETRHGVDTDPPGCGWPPWRYANDPDPDRQQARRILRWLTAAADAIPLLDPARGRHVGARFHFARTDDELRLVRDRARHGLAEHGDLPSEMPPCQAEQPWRWPASWMNAAWLRGTIAYLDWVLGESPVGPLSGEHRPLDPITTLITPEPPYGPADLIAMRGVGCGVANIEEELMTYLDAVIMQGHEGQPKAEPARYPPPQWEKPSSKPTTGQPVKTLSHPPPMAAAPTVPARSLDRSEAKPRWPGRSVERYR
ncbi:MAG TPA: hypothetical protein VFQ44_06755 [Streptosporangiaceae bacterium]|nr:hypothetical protein [Streptosporangiaceae bacterium]